MKNLFLSLFLMIAIIFPVLSQAGVSDVKMCLDFSVRKSESPAIIATARCEVTQVLALSALKGTWSCAFNGGPLEKMDFLATWVTHTFDDPQTEPSVIFYDIFPQEDFGSFFIRGLGLSDVTFGTNFTVELGETPSTTTPDAMLMTANHQFDFLNLAHAAYGSCN